MRPRQVSEAFEIFREGAERAGLREIAQESSAGEPGDRMLTAVCDGASMRLVWSAREETLTLEVTHGPDPPGNEFWLDLFSAQCPGGVIPADTASERDFLSSLKYGLDLFNPGWSTGDV